MQYFFRGLSVVATCACLLSLAACAGVHRDGQPSATSVAPNAAAGQIYAPFPEVHSVASAKLASQPASSWKNYLLPGKKPTTYSYQWQDGRHTVAAYASTSASMLRQRLRVERGEGKKLNFSWKVPELVAGADLARREAHDAPVRLALVFEGDRAKFSAKNAMLSELALALTGEELPYATLVYTWCNACRVDDIMLNPRTDRIREIALESGPAHLNMWRDYQRNIEEDFERAFSEAPGALIGVGLMTDTDNTGQTVTSWYGPVFFSD